MTDKLLYLTDFATYCEYKGCRYPIPNGKPDGRYIQKRYCTYHKKDAQRERQNKWHKELRKAQS